MIEAGNSDPNGAMVAVVIATWNRKHDAVRAIESLARQSIGAARLHVIVVDNAATDGTWNDLIARFSPDSLVENRCSDASGHEFVTISTPHARGTAAGFVSLTLIRNTVNLGGTGGFNTGMAYIRNVLDGRVPQGRPEYVWLLDDDAEVRDDAAAKLLEAMRSDPEIGIVGSRSVDPLDRTTTLETTVFLNRETGLFCDDAPPGHPSHASHQEWLSTGVQPRGRHEYSGLVRSDICAAASLMARIEVLRQVGLWDHRFFLYEDDADWCLRAAGAGWRVVCNLDAVVYHRTWHARLSPRLFQTRLYYVARNRVWLLRNNITDTRRAGVVGTWVSQTLADSFRANLHRRAAHAELLLRAMDAACSNTGGRLPITLATPTPVLGALDSIGALKPGSRIAVVCDQPGCAESSDALRRAVAAHIASSTTPNAAMPEWIELVRNDLSPPPAPPGARRIIYSFRARSKIRRQLPLLLRPPAAVVIFDGRGDFPLITGRAVLHIDRASPDVCEVERASLAQRIWFIFRWVRVMLKARAMRR